MSCSLQHDSTHSNGVTTVITIIAKHSLTSVERNLLYRHIWGWLEAQCIEPLSVKVEEEKVDCSLKHDSIIGRQRLRFGSKRHHQTVDVPPGVSAENAMKLYSQGWGHSLANSLHFLTKHIGLMEIDPELREAYIAFMKSKWRLWHSGS